MNDDTLDQILADWLREGPDRGRVEALDRALAATRRTSQRPGWRQASWPARRFAQMNTYAKLAMAAAAVVALAVIGFNVIPRNSGVGGVGGQSPTPAPTATPTPTPAPTEPSAGALAPGTYRSDFMTYTVPAGWSSYQSWGANKNDGIPPDGMFIAPWSNIGTVYADPCHWQSTPVARVALPTVDALVAALGAQKRDATATPVDVTINGFQGKEIDLMVPLSIKVAPGTNADGGSGVVSGCDRGLYKGWTDTSGGDRYNQGPGQHDLLDIIDVNGRTLVIDRAFYAATTAADRAQLQAIFDSVKITP
jgi:hypothetical protein